nr:hypothetical protein [Mycobacterium avium]
MRCTVCGPGYLGSTHAVGLAELGYAAPGLDIERGNAGKLAWGYSHLYEHGPA